MSASKTIVIVEDDEFMARLYISKFKNSGFIVHRAHNGEEGLKLICDLKPNVVLMDVNLPQKNGLEVLAELRANRLVSQIPVVMLTNSSNVTDVARAQELGVSDYLIKANSLPSEVLARVIRNCV